MPIIDREVIRVTASTFDIPQRKQANINLRSLAKKYNSAPLKELANAFAKNQAGDTIGAVAIFHKLYSQADNVGDRVHFGTKACCATASAIDKGKNKPSTASYTLWPGLSKILGHAMEKLADLETWRRNLLGSLVAEAIKGKPSNTDLDGMYKLLQGIKAVDLQEGILPETFAYVAIAALNCNDVPELTNGDNQSRLAAFANVLKEFGQEFPRGYLIYVRYLLTTRHWDLAAKVLQDPILQKHAASNAPLADIISYQQQVIERLQQTSSEQEIQNILAEFTRTEGDPLGHPVSTLADSKPVQTGLSQKTLSQEWLSFA